ncbi:MAG: CDP-2,3-bis-(O-geranylgeranyl)-sn-glycerol synthase [Candidatus Jordarchaeales archaeon]
MDLLILLVLALWYILPAYAANGLAVIFGRGKRFNMPLDLGRNFIDGKRLFGDGKTLRGFVGGVVAGTFVGAAQSIAGSTVGIPMLLSSPQVTFFLFAANALSPQHAHLILVNALFFTPLLFFLLGYPSTSKEIIMPSILKGFLLSLGALTGDLVGSFIKRRLNLDRGTPAPGLDQLDFIAGAILLSSWFYLPPVEVLLVVVIVTPVIHLLANAGAYVLRLKKEPW